MLLNLDAGEHADEPPELWALADILCVACGGHAGDEASMTRVVTFCAAHPAIALGAHPSYPDRANFGRVSAGDVSLDALVTQLAALTRIAAAHGVRVRYVKPHGALYHDAARDPVLAAKVIDAARTVIPDAVIIGPAHGELAARANSYLREGFADRAVRPDGVLVPRGEPGALITDPAAAAARARELAGEVDTVCCHADTPGALAIVRAVREAL